MYLQAAQSEVTDWLPPATALAQFEPPEGVRLAVAQAGLREEVVRYGFRVGTVGLLIPYDAGSEILEMPAVASMPGAPPGFLGLINLRGNLVPIYELRTLLHLEPRKPGAKAMALVFDQGVNAVGVVVDDFPLALKALTAMPALPPVPDALQGHVHTAYMKDEMIWLEFNHGTLFDEVSRGIRLETV